MSTSLPAFQFGEVASAAKLMDAFNVLRDQGNAILKTLGTYRTLSLVDFEQKVETLNSRRQRANRINPPFTAVSFVATDFLDLDQSLTSATVRADAQAVTLKERSTETNAILQTQTFATSDGVAESISSDGSLYRVESGNGVIPTGTFSLQLRQALSMSVLTFDLAAMPPTPVFQVSASLDGATYVQATRVSMNGYRLTAWFPPTEIKYVSLAITPAAPDTLGGTSYTFGLTDFLGSETEFQLMSDLVTLPISFAPAGVSLLLAAPADPGLLYFLNFNNTLWQEYPAGAVVSIPGATGLTQANVTIGTGGLLNITLPANTYLRSIKVTDQATGKPVALAPGLLPTDSRVSALTNGYVAVTPGGSAPALYYVSSTLSADMGKTFTVSYAAGPSTMSVQLKVQFLTSDRTETPTFTGASLQEF